MYNMINDNIKNKKVVLRVDYNVTIKEGKIIDNTKIKKSLKTINYLLKNNNTLLIMSHLGRIKTEEDKVFNDLSIVSQELECLLEEKVVFINDTKGKELEESVENNRITLMQNTRYEDFDQKKESGCDLELAKYWASLGEVFVNDAFATSHRKHASNYGISKYLPSYIGYLIQEEIKGLEPLINVVDHPFVVVMGGAKVDDKIELIESILKECDYLLLGGGIANTFIKAQDYEIGKSLCSYDYIDKVKILLESKKNKIILPVDFIVENNSTVNCRTINNILEDDVIYDIGNDTINIYNEILRKGKVIFINGTVGMYENDLFKNGTVQLLKNLENCTGRKIVGGGDALSALNNLGYSDNVDYISTGGGATLEYIAKKRLECLGD